MKTHNTLASFRRRPESSGFNDILDSGLGFGFLRHSTSSIPGVVRRNDGNKVNGTAVSLTIACLSLIFAVGLSLPCSVANAATKNAPVILVMGDSLSAGYRIPAERSWVSLLQKRLQAENLPQRVINASISGETSSGGLTRLPAALHQYQPEIVILELGANDGLRGLPLAVMRSNLQRMITASQKINARVLLLGMRLPPNYGPAYTRQFADVFVELAQQYNTAFVPFLLDGVATRRELMQDDGLHPKAKAQPQLLDNVWPHLLPLLKN